MIQNGQTEPKQAFGLLGVTRRRMGYVERRSLFVAKRIKSFLGFNYEEFLYSINIFDKIICLFAIFSFLRSGLF